jgi:uncharacterized protein (TIGR00369 family)
MNANLKPIFNKFLSLSNYGKEFYKVLSIIESDHLIQINHDSEVLFRLNVLDEFCNIQKTLHGGAIGTIIDITTTIAISSLDKKTRKNVSVELSTHFINPIKLNSEILIYCKIPKIGKTLAYSYIDILDYESRKLMSSGNHIKAMLDQSWLH